MIAAYIVKSEANAREFQADFVFDNGEFWTSVIKSAVGTHSELVRLMREMAASAGVAEEVVLNAAVEEEKHGPPIKEPRGEAAAIKQVMNEEGTRVYCQQDRLGYCHRSLPGWLRQTGWVECY